MSPVLNLTPEMSERMSPRIRVAIIGLGSAARRIHIPAYRRVEGLEVVCGCDIAPHPGAFGFPVYDSVDRMTDAHSVDIAVIATPVESHFALASRFLAQGIHVFCEKPFASS